MKKIASFLLSAAMVFSGATAVYSSVPNTSAKAVSVNAAEIGEITTSASYTKDTAGFVRRMYNIVLNREPDEAGLKSWTTKLNNHTATAGDLIYGFFWSSEYRGKNKSAEEIVDDCYRAMLDRSPDSAGSKTWVQRLDIGMTHLAVCKGFVGSDEFKNLCASYGINPGTIKTSYIRDENFERTYFVYRLYSNCLGRTPDIAGLENWCKNLKNGTTGSSIVKGFIFSNEYRSRATANPEFVDMLYRTLLGRNSDQNGAAKWTSKLNYANTREFVTNGFLFSDEFKGQCAKAGIKVGSALPTKDDTFEWWFNVTALEYVNSYRVRNGKHLLVAQQDLWERFTSVRANDLLVRYDTVRPDGTKPNDFLNEVIGSTAYDLYAESFICGFDEYKDPSDFADYVYGYLSGWRNYFNDDEYDLFAAANSYDSSHEYYYTTLVDIY